MRLSRRSRLSAASRNYSSWPICFLILFFLFLPMPSLAQDADGDGMPDSYENTYGCLMTNTVDAAVDYDSDAMTSLEEYLYSTVLDPCNADTDGDGLPDGWEVQYQAYGLDPLSYWSEIIGKIGADHRVTNTSPYHDYFPSLSWTGSEFGVSWSEWRDSNYGIYFARVSVSGSKIGADLQVTSNPYANQFPSLSWTGSEFGLSWSDNRNSNDNPEIYFARISAAGVLIGADIRVTSDPNYSYYPSLSWTGSEFGVSWMDYRDGDYEIYFARVSVAGSKIGADTRVSSAIGLSYYPSLSWTGSEFGVSWRDKRDGGLYYEIYFARISSAGVKIGADLRVTSDASGTTDASLSWSGSEFGLSWYQYRNGNYEICFTRISAAGAKIIEDLHVTSGPPGGMGEPSLYWTGSEFGLAWMDPRDGYYEIYFARVSSAGAKIGADLRVTNDPSFSGSPSLSWTGSEFGVSWSDSRDGNGEIYFARISAEAGEYTDNDSDGLPEDEEYNNGTNPGDPDTDNGGEDDGSEVAGGRDPLDGLDDIISPVNLTGVPLDGALVWLTWEPSPSPRAVQYNLYWDNATGTINYATPLVSVAIASPLTHTTGPLTPGIPYQFVVRVEVIGGAEDQNTNAVTVIPFISSAGKVQACIKHPGTGHKFNGNLLLVKAEICVGNESDVSGVLLQWRPEGGGSWSDVPAGDGRPNPDPDSPYFVHWDVTGLAVGSYELRAVAYNLSMVPDPEPPVSDFYIEKYHPDREMKIGANGQPESKARAYVTTDLAIEVVDAGQDRPAKVEVPSQALSENSVLELGIESPADHYSKVNLSIFKNPESFLRVGLESGQNTLSNGKKATLTFAYQDADSDGFVDGTDIEETELCPHSWNVSKAKWEPLEDVQVDVGKNVVTGKTRHFSLFAVLDDRDNDHDGLIDQDEDLWGTNRNLWDTDNDNLPDGWETTQSSGGTVFDPLDINDGNADFDSDGISNMHEYWNGTDPWHMDPMPNPLFPDSPGCYYWGEADGDGYVLANDKSILQGQILGASQPYSNVIPRGTPDVQDLDADGYILGGDLSILKSFIVAGLVGPVGSRAAALEKVYEPLLPVAVGGTAHVTVRVRNESVENNLYSGGFAVVFSIDPSSTGAAMLLGGDGAYGAGTRFDVSGPSGAADGGHTTIFMKVTEPGAIIINATIPACGAHGIGRWADEIGLDPAFSITAAMP